MNQILPSALPCFVSCPERFAVGPSRHSSFYTRQLFGEALRFNYQATATSLCCKPAPFGCCFGALRDEDKRPSSHICLSLPGKNCDREQLNSYFLLTKPGHSTLMLKDSHRSNNELTLPTEASRILDWPN
ncbi:hypothetical protein NDU88_006037 [Pleurodeles waltl]|uniref:Uncharacterized protein n=1 Tax=Pleurodeles waltl TaxID=8319 RepID=A0AAV7MY14_PLEWA|nr:hypothetical protein NDU88_006037 [Pleurodeles waltl]